jgi:GNAT superfamily N-acetyltransferase
MPDTAPLLQIRPAVRTDCPLILAFIRELADYEKLSDEVVATEEALAATLFGEPSYASVLIAELAGEAAGFALYFFNYSTFLARPGIYLEDLYVRPASRGDGVGKALLAQVAQAAVQHRCGRLEWSVLDWNTPALDFYRAVGAAPMDEWTVQRLTGDALRALAAQALPAAG